MKPPTYQKEVCRFIGGFNYYRDVWSMRSHILLHLNHILTSQL